VLAIDDALTLLAAVDEQLARIVELRFFGGLEHQEIAAALDVELLTVDRGWRVARAWLANAIETEGREP
jgi:DNA-directed RNA polymerase specialized sigma24 family protein